MRADDQSDRIVPAAETGSCAVPALHEPAIAGLAVKATTRDGHFAVYVITEQATGRQYVGVTGQTTVEARFMGHLYDAASRTKRRRSGSLAEAIIRTIASGLTYRQAFSVRCLDIAEDPAAARLLEAAWIAQLGTASPAGFNLMRGGSSLGGPANSRPVVVSDENGEQHYPSLSGAIRATSGCRRRAGQRCVGSPAIYARLSMGWSPGEALGVVARTDGRRRRDPFVWRGREYETLREVSELSGLSVETLRSRLHRRRRADANGIPDITHDRRATASGKNDGILVPTPDGRALVTLQDYARMTGLPESTVPDRYWQLVRAGRRPEAMPPDELAAFLGADQDRRILLELEVAPDVVWRGGVRELIRRLLGDVSVEARRAKRIGGSAIRKRLRGLPGWRGQLQAAHVRWAFGFESRKPSDIS